MLSNLEVWDFSFHCSFSYRGGKDPHFSGCIYKVVLGTSGLEIKVDVLLQGPNKELHG